MSRGPELRIVSPGTTSEEAAAVVAAIEQFVRQYTTGTAGAPAAPVPAWKAAALGEGVRRAPDPPPRWE